MNSCQIFYAIALIICVGGWIGLFYYCFSAPKDYKGLCPEDVVGRIKRAPKKTKPPTELDKLLIKPDGVESPVHEICVAILENLDTKRFRFSIESKKIEHTQVSTYIHTSVLIYDTHKKVSMSFTESYIPGSLYYFIDGLSVGDIAITLSQKEGNYVKSVYDYVRQHLKLKKDKLAKLKEQRHRRAITKLYSEDNNDQTN